jgi:hypothetical protein
MRKDMFKVIVERPRVGGGNKRNRRVNKEFTDLAKSWNGQEDEAFDLVYDSINASNNERLKHQVDNSNMKEQTDNLNPLYGLLLARLGKPWNDVYSEICEHLNRNSTMQNHVFQHLEWAVVKSTYRGEDGHVYESTTRKWRGQALDTPKQRKVFYLEPETGILRCSPTMIYNKESVTKVTLENGDQFRLIDGQWYRIELRHISRKMADRDGYFTSNLFSKIGDILFPDGLPDWERNKEYGSINLYAVSKRIIGRREERLLRKLLATKIQGGSTG